MLPANGLENVIIFDHHRPFRNRPSFARVGIRWKTILPADFHPSVRGQLLKKQKRKRKRHVHHLIPRAWPWNLRHTRNTFWNEGTHFSYEPSLLVARGASCVHVKMRDCAHRTISCRDIFISRTISRTISPSIIYLRCVAWLLIIPTRVYRDEPKLCGNITPQHKHALFGSANASSAQLPLPSAHETQLNTTSGPETSVNWMFMLLFSPPESTCAHQPTRKLQSVKEASMYSANPYEGIYLKLSSLPWRVEGKGVCSRSTSAWISSPHFTIGENPW